jgi:hypothetical protein
LSKLSLFSVRDAILHKNAGQEEEMMGKQPMKKTRKTTPQRRSNRLTKADMQTRIALGRIIEEDRRIEQKYNLPFRSPRQVATSLQRCGHCFQDIALLIFGNLAKDAADLEAYVRLTEDLIKQTTLPTYIIAPPSNPQDLDSPALLLKVSPE